MSSISEQQRQPSHTLMVQGHHFDKGVLSALRAYPVIGIIERHTTPGEYDQLFLEVNVSPLDDDTMISLLIDVITQSGGEVSSARHIKGDTDRHANENLDES